MELFFGRDSMCVKTIIKKIQNNTKNQRILVIGDTILDNYVIGDTLRISPEAPVPILSVREEFFRLGGAANVAHNLATLNSTIFYQSVVGIDGDGILITELSQDAKINTDLLLTTKNVTTIRKVRFMRQGQQILRVDFERKWNKDFDPVYYYDWKTFLSVISTCNGIVISDYQKGVCTPSLIRRIIDVALTRNIPVMVSTKARDWEIYKGAFAIVINRKEFEDVIGETFSFQALTKVKLYGTILIVTLGDDGCVFYDGFQIIKCSTKKQQAHDVVGAGDTFFAIFSLTTLLQISIVDALTIANIASGAVITNMEEKTLNIKKLVQLVTRYFNEGKNRVTFIPIEC